MLQPIPCMTRRAVISGNTAAEGMTHPTWTRTTYSFGASRSFLMNQCLSTETVLIIPPKNTYWAFICLTYYIWPPWPKKRCTWFFYWTWLKLRKFMNIYMFLMQIHVFLWKFSSETDILQISSLHPWANHEIDWNRNFQCNLYVWWTQNHNILVQNIRACRRLKPDGLIRHTTDY